MVEEIMGLGSVSGVTTKYDTKVKNKKKAFATVVPAPRKSVKRMVFESVLDFFVRLFSSDPRNEETQVANNLVLGASKMEEIKTKHMFN